MREKEFDFDMQISDRLSEIIPPESEIDLTNPWSLPISFITWGLILTTIHLNFLLLQYTLPILGATLILLGSRMIRNENTYFRILWFLSMFKMVQHLADILVKATPLNLIEFPEITVGLLALSLQITFFLIFHMGLKGVYKKTGEEMMGHPLIWASLWTLVAFLIAISDLAQSWMVFIPMIVFYILIVRALLSVGNRLDVTGYGLSNSPVKINGRTIGWSYFLITLVLAVGLNVYFGHLAPLSMEYNWPDDTVQRQALIERGFPKEALQYLDDDRVKMLEDVGNIEVFNKTLMFDPAMIEHKEEYAGGAIISHTYEAGKANMDVATIYAEMTDGSLYVMQYFKWTSGKPVWQDGIVIYGAYGEEGTEMDREGSKELVDSGIFYQKNGTGYVADFPRIVCEDVTVNNMFGSYSSKPVRAAVSYPFGAREQGGYIIYRYGGVKKQNKTFYSYSTFNYVHRQAPFSFPYFRTEERMVKGGYEILDELNQHYTNYDSLALRNLSVNWPKNQDGSELFE